MVAKTDIARLQKQVDTLTRELQRARADQGAMSERVKMVQIIQGERGKDVEDLKAKAAEVDALKARVDKLEAFLPVRGTIPPEDVNL